VGSSGPDRRQTARPKLPPPHTGAAEPAAACGTASLESTRARVAAGKLEAQAALNDPDAAWEAYLAGQRAQIAAAQASPSAARELPERLAVLAADASAGAPGLARRKRVFLRNLRDINRRNAESGDTLAFGINDFTHLTDKEFQRIYLSSLPPAGIAGSYRGDGVRKWVCRGIPVLLLAVGGWSMR
jgi:hypothetical protein